MKQYLEDVLVQIDQTDSGSGFITLVGLRIREIAFAPHRGTFVSGTGVAAKEPAASLLSDIHHHRITGPMRIVAPGKWSLSGSFKIKELEHDAGTSREDRVKVLLLGVGPVELHPHEVDT